MVSAWSCKTYFNHCLTEWNSNRLNVCFQRFHIDVQALKQRCHVQFNKNEDTFSVYFDELEHYFTENGEKQHT